LLVAVPKLAQEKLDEAELTLDKITVTGTQSKRLTMKIDTQIHTDGSVHATVMGFEGVMYLTDYEPQTPFARINFPETTSEKHQVVNVTQEIEIDDVEALTRFNTWLLHNETVRVTVEGDTKVKVRGIPRKYGVTFKKTIEMPGLKMFEGLKVNETSINLNPTDNFWGTAWIPNRSQVAIELGNVTFHDYLLGEEVGEVYLDNLTLQPGMNRHIMRATIEADPVLNAMQSEPYCHPGKGILPFVIRGKKVVNNGQSLDYLANALATGNQTVPIDIGWTLKNSLNITLPCKDDSE